MVNPSTESTDLRDRGQMTCFETEVFNIRARYKQKHQLRGKMNFVWDTRSQIRGFADRARDG